MNCATSNGRFQEAAECEAQSPVNNVYLNPRAALLAKARKLREKANELEALVYALPGVMIPEAEQALALLANGAIVVS